MIRVVVVDDHTLMRQGLVGLLDEDPDLVVVGQAGDASSALDVIEEMRPDVVLMDVGLPGVSGLELTVRVKRIVPDIRVLVLTMYEREDYLFQALQAGASGYVLKGADIQDLLTAVRTVARGDTYVYQSLTGKLVADYLSRIEDGADRRDYDGLSRREREVLALIAEGLTTSQIADRLYVSPHTVQTHRDHVMTKLDLHSRVALTKYAIRKGLIELEK
ncbi:MAG TPA: response regulator transcription factor [Acidimicrobiia bacterium]|nr:response regulator transcription factor [Acidimicrobiia bacterium]